MKNNSVQLTLMHYIHTLHSYLISPLIVWIAARACPGVPTSATVYTMLYWTREWIGPCTLWATKTATWYLFI